MIPVLYRGDATAFSNNGYGGLSDAKSCIVTEELNGAYTLTMKYPKNGLHAEYIQPRNLIKAAVDTRAKTNRFTQQVFRINKITDSLTGNDMTVEAQHISYDLSGIPMPSFEATGIFNILNQLKNNSIAGNHNFTFNTNLTNTTSKFRTEVPRSIRSCMGGEEGSILQIFKCEFQYNNFTVSFLSRRGADNGVRIEYGKNLESFVNVKTTDNCYNGVVGYWFKDNVLVQVIQQYDVYDPESKNIDFYGDKYLILDCTDKFENQPTETELNAYVTDYANVNHLGYTHLNSMTVKFIPLWQTEEHKDLAPLESVELGDTVHVTYERHDYSLRVVNTQFDVLNERFVQIELGEKKSTMSKTIQSIAKETYQSMSREIPIESM